MLAEARSRDTRQALTTKMLDAPLSGAASSSSFRLRISESPVPSGRNSIPRSKTAERAVKILVGEEGEDADTSASHSMFDDTFGAQLLHRGVEEDVEFDTNDESLGTLVWFGLVGPVIKALADGAVFLADELDASLHPVLVAHVISLFQNPSTNPRRAQLIFNSHDTTILGESAADRVVEGKGSRLLRSRRIWFTEKTNDGATVFIR